MLIGHLPASYLWSRFLQRRMGVDTRHGLTIGLVGGILPDMDLIRYYLIDHGRFYHHAYWTHLPLIWLLLALPLFLLARAAQERHWFNGAILLLTNIFLHLCLDTIAGGGIRWGFPFDDQYYVLVNIPSPTPWWVVNFIRHWTFGLEIAMVIAAGWLLRQERREQSATLAGASSALKKLPPPAWGKPTPDDQAANG